MTTIVAVTHDACSVTMGADSRTSVYDHPVDTCTKIRIVHPDNHRGIIGFGVAGDGAMAEIIAASSSDIGAIETPRPDAEPETFNEWAGILARTVTKLAIDHGIQTDGRLTGSLILAHSGRLWTIVHHQAIFHADGVAVAGSGGDVALGAIAGMRRAGIDDPQSLVRGALEIAIAGDLYSGGALKVVTLL